ncbi:MAG: DUF3667 domain-containing protein [Ignavibacteria bacterium]
MEDNSINPENKCASCGKILYGKYCSQCGEKITDPKDLSLFKFISQTLDIFSNFDSKFFRSFWYLVSRPGFLTLEYLSGRRINYRKPLQFFLIINILYFFIQPFTILNVFNTNLDSHRNEQMYSKIAGQMVSEKISIENISLQDYGAKFNSTIEKLSRSLILVNIPIYALIVFALSFRKRKYFGESLIFSIHIYSFILIITSLILFIVRLLDPAVLLNDSIMTAVIFAVLSCYLYIASGRVFAFRGINLIIKSIIFTAAFFFVLAIYRMILFLVTFYST